MPNQSKWLRRARMALIVMLSALVGLNIFLGEWLMAFNNTIWVGIVIMMGRGERYARQAGYYEGRGITLAALAEAMRRGWAFHEWIEVEAARDGIYTEPPRRGIHDDD